MIEASPRLLPPDPRWLDFAGFVAPPANDGEDSAPEIRADAQVEDESRRLVGSTADR